MGRLFSVFSPSAWATLGLLLILTSAVGWGHEGRRAAQVLVLAAPLLAWLWWPVASVWQRPRAWLVGLGLMVFVVDGLVRGYLWTRYAAAPDSAVVLQAVANTGWREGLEYLQSHGWSWGPLLGLAVLACAGIAALVRVGSTAVGAIGDGRRRALLLLLVVCAGCHLSKPWRRLHPVVFWPDWVQAVHTQQANWARQGALRQHRLAHAQALAPAYVGQGSNTVVLVLTDSVNRDNLGLYGYPRDTTPNLLRLAREEGAHWLTLRHAWSAEPGTLASLAGLFGFGEPEGPLHLLALARAAGYKVWWLSNHDDLAIEQIHARLADATAFANRQPGRSSQSLDEAVLVPFKRALADPSERKLVVLHLLGAHPHYGLRQPHRWDPFSEAEDAVTAAMKAQGRPMWLREMRRLYDEAVHYHDGIVAHTFSATRAARAPCRSLAWIYLSDHGQEVGHSVNRMGHSPGTPAGYRIPALIWRHPEAPPAGLAHRPFRGDWAAWTVSDLLQIDWPGRNRARNVLASEYRWAPPPLPLKGIDFHQ